MYAADMSSRWEERCLGERFKNARLCVAGWQGEVPWRVTCDGGAHEAALVPESPRGHLSGGSSLQRSLELSLGLGGSFILKCSSEGRSVVVGLLALLFPNGCSGKDVLKGRCEVCLGLWLMSGMTAREHHGCRGMHGAMDEVVDNSVALHCRATQHLARHC